IIDRSGPTYVTGFAKRHVTSTPGLPAIHWPKRGIPAGSRANAGAHSGSGIGGVQLNTIAVQRRVPTRFGSRQAALVALMFGFSVMSYFDRTILSIAGPGIMQEFGIPPTRMGWVYSAFILGYAIFMIPGGDFADRLGPRKTLTL